MADRLVTIATFYNTAKARIAQNVLEAAGIRAAVADETVVAMDWLLGPAIGGVKVQVWEADADRAVAVLEDQFGADGERLDDIDPEAFAAEAEAASPEDIDGRPEPRTESPLTAQTPPRDTPAAESVRDGYARSLFVVAWFSIILWPLTFYAIYLALNAMFGEGKLSGRGRFNLLVGLGTLAGPMLLIWLVISRLWI